MTQWITMQETQETWIWSLGLEDSPGGGNGNQLQYSCLENPMDRGAWQATVYGVSRSRTWLNHQAYSSTHSQGGWQSWQRTAEEGPLEYQERWKMSIGTCFWEAGAREKTLPGEHMVKSHPDSGSSLCDSQDRGANAGQKESRRLGLASEQWLNLGRVKSKEAILDSVLKVKGSCDGV